MYEMFESASAFNQDITGWCVTNITTEPEGCGFAPGSALTEALTDRCGGLALNTGISILSEFWSINAVKTVSIFKKRQIMTIIVVDIKKPSESPEGYL